MIFSTLYYDIFDVIDLVEYEYLDVFESKLFVNECGIAYLHRTGKIAAEFQPYISKGFDVYIV